MMLGMLLATRLEASDWTLYRFEGRDYVTLDNIAQFYGLPAPGTIVATAAEIAGSSESPPVAAPSLVTVSGATPPPSPTASAAPQPASVSSISPTSPPSGITPSSAATTIQGPPKSTPPTPASTGPSESEGPGASLDPVGGHFIKLQNDRFEFAVALNSREAEINGVKQWLAFPARVQDGKVMISRLDLSKVIEPRLRPEKVQGLRPVTTVVLDPGHGGHDNGAISRYGFEKDFALDVALAARTRLEKMGVKVVMTRSADIFVPLPQRAAVANGIKDSIFVSIHFNSATSNPSARGFEIYSLAPRGAPATNDGNFTIRNLREEPGNVVDTLSTALAGTVFHSLLGNVPLPDRGLKHARFAVLRLCTQPAVLIECGFVSNSAESALIGSPAWRNKVAEAIVTGVESYKDLAEQGQKPRHMADYRRVSSVPQ
jgi:N-acetylmuramoyl-L-alanine amidase